MRFHARHPQLQRWQPISAAAKLVRAGNLRFAQYRRAADCPVLELTFARGDASATVGGIEVDVDALQQRARSPLIWPLAAKVASYPALLEIERRILPWLASHALARTPGDAFFREFEAPGRVLPCRTFVREPDLPVSGGSSGRLLFLLRRGFECREDADADEARALAARLRSEGFTVDLCDDSRIDAATECDLVHVFAPHLQPYVEPILHAMRARGTQVVAEASVQPPKVDAAAVVRAIFARCRDEAALNEQLGLLDAALQSQCADGRTPSRPTYQEPPESDGVPPPPYEFVFAHAPIEWRTNLPVLARACISAGLPLVIAGPVVDCDAAQEARDAGARIIEPSERRCVKALYASARVFADVAWQPAGRYRLERAGAYGCRVVEGAYASIPRLAAALREAWDGPTPACPAVPGQALAAVIASYAAPAGASP